MTESCGKVRHDEEVSPFVLSGRGRRLVVGESNEVCTVLLGRDRLDLTASQGKIIGPARGELKARGVDEAHVPVAQL